LKKEKLPDKSDIKGKFGPAGIPHYLRSDGEVSTWLTSVFKWIKSGDVVVTFEAIAKELSAFSGRDITGDHISRAYRRWKKTGKY
jgi:hypothetical protein